MSKRSTLFGICPYVTALELIAGRWKLLIIKYIGDGYTRFGQLRRKLPGTTQSTLANQLRELEKDGLIIRTVYAEMPPHVEYTLSDSGRKLTALVSDIGDWGRDYLETHPELREHSAEAEEKGD